ncbi:DUF3422 domain-containing protein [Pontixanthobacter aestiaquae]|uniref:DUF3422 family protein n=1 Tax=Pontixanthobacter aestiaquae TaxID=1509367 RepID=A0A844Z8Q6_9SPHN|nr:DUF3422 domain-containing protein [Pontixanthobacter aestiaquae]MDN3644795.1 DUF3422 domain-containing protein [Pontixanthobacter aestiaquae]MXO84198.1 DUF3422 family protein [Pontixanthobacter aestiaquae]
MRPTDHPLRQWAVNEMHLRKFAPVPGHCEIYQAVRLLSADDRHKEDGRLMGDKPDFDEWAVRERYAAGHCKSGIHFLWERHSEATTLTLILPNGGTEEANAPYIRWLEEWNGPVIRATRVFVIPDASNIDQHLQTHGMDLNELVCSDVSGDLRIWSDFGIRGDGYGRLIATAGDVSAPERGRIIQRLQELGNYRNLALLGLPLVQEYGPKADALEAQLSDHAERVALAEDGAHDDDLLQELIEISSKLEVIRSATGFRLSATAAYAGVAADRLAGLSIKTVSNLQSLTEFTERRLVPAARTCSVFTDRLARIAERISRVMHTLDVRVDTRIKEQNLILTKRMERSIQLQFRLQSLVEGLSVIAAAYYLVGLIGFLIKGVWAWPSGSSADLVIAAVTLPVIGLIYAFVHRTRGTVLKETDLESN